MSTVETVSSWLEEKLSKLKKPESLAKVQLDRQSIEYFTYLIALYSDIDWNDLTATLNHCNRTDHKHKDMMDYYASLCKKGVPVTDRIVFDIDKEWNEPISKLAMYRRAYERSMAELGKSIPSETPLFKIDRSEDVGRLSKLSDLGMNLLYLRNLSPRDLDRIFEAQEQIRIAKCDKIGSSYRIAIVRLITRCVPTRYTLPNRESIMPTIQSLKNALKGKAPKSQKPSKEDPDWVTTNEPSFVVRKSPPVVLDAKVLEYIMYLKPLYSDITFDDLTSTANRLYNTNFTKKDIEENYMYKCEAMVRQRMQDNAALHRPTPSNIMELEGPFLWMKKDSALEGQENDIDYNKLINTLAKHRRKYEATLAAIRGCLRSKIDVANPYRLADVERLLEGRLTVEALCDLSYLDLELILDKRGC
ncbi:MAG: hypothetical protein Q9221_006012 [Calogaya cf. arnoldii]